jgi:CubicO group peptidase (beta-lactamase class C family)
LPDGVERFYWASVGKLATAVLVLQQLVQENSLQLDQRLSQWYPTLPGANAITLEMVLSHRAGFASHNEFEEFRKRSAPATPEEVARFLEARPPSLLPRDRLVLLEQWLLVTRANHRTEPLERALVIAAFCHKNCGADRCE